MGRAYLTSIIRISDDNVAVPAGLSAIAAMGIQSIFSWTALVEFGTTSVITANSAPLESLTELIP
jgi:hypothetical protein